MVKINLSDIYLSPSVEAINIAKAAERNKNLHYEGYGIAASALGTECDRQLFLDWRWASAPVPVEGKNVSIFERGDWEEHRTLKDLARIPDVDLQPVDPLTGKQWAFTLANGAIRGKADGKIKGLLEATTALHVLEIKSMKDSDWKNVIKKGPFKAKEEHWWQVQAGMAGLGIDRGAYVIRNKATEELHIERIKLDTDAIDGAVRRVEHIVNTTDMPIGSYDEKKTADKIKPPSPCAFCKHKGICYEGKFPRRTCRSCIHFTHTHDGEGSCARFGKQVHPKGQKEDCPMHRYLPSMVPGEQVDADEEAETITYTMPNGTEWTDGAVA